MKFSYPDVPEEFVQEISVSSFIGRLRLVDHKELNGALIHLLEFEHNDVIEAIKELFQKYINRKPLSDQPPICF